MQQTTKKTYEIFGEPTTTIPHNINKNNDKRLIWKQKDEVIDRSGHSFYFPIRFETEDKIQNGYTFVLIRLEKSVPHGTNVAYYYAYACIETGYVEIYTKHEVNDFVKCMNNLDVRTNVELLIRLAYGSTKRVGNGEKATDKPLEEITNFNDYERYYRNFYWTNVEEDLYTHVTYGFYNDTTSYIGVTGIDKSTNIMTPTRLGQHNNNSNEKGYTIILRLQYLLSL